MQATAQDIHNIMTADDGVLADLAKRDDGQYKFAGFLLGFNH